MSGLRTCRRTCLEGVDEKDLLPPYCPLLPPTPKGALCVVRNSGRLILFFCSNGPYVLNTNFVKNTLVLLLAWYVCFRINTL